MKRLFTTAIWFLLAMIASVAAISALMVYIATNAGPDTNQTAVTLSNG